MARGFVCAAAALEAANGQWGPKLSIWLIAFCSAFLAVQASVALGVLDVGEARQIAAVGSMSGAILGGLLFGVGMVLVRGCASRLLVLSASGNLRAIVTGLVLTLTAEATLRGVLAPAREALAGFWLVSGGDARMLFQGDATMVMVIACVVAVTLILSVATGYARGVSIGALVAASYVGLAVFAGWQGTYMLSQASFDIVAVQYVTFTGPSTDTLMALVNQRAIAPGFGVGLVPGVFLGAFLGALTKREARIQRFEPDTPMERYLFGGVFMGFGSMLAGGCAVGAGMTGGSVLALTAWTAGFSTWIGAMATHRLLNAPGQWRLV